MMQNGFLNAGKMLGKHTAVFGRFRRYTRNPAAARRVSSPKRLLQGAGNCVCPIQNVSRHHFKAAHDRERRLGMLRALRRGQFNARQRVGESGSLNDRLGDNLGTIMCRCKRRLNALCHGCNCIDAVQSRLGGLFHVNELFRYFG